MSGIQAQIKEVIKPIIHEEALSLYEVFWAQGARILQVLIEKENGSVSLDDCVRVSHAIEDIIEVKDIISGKYCLEVSSPGLDRPLSCKEHFQRVVGQMIRVKTKGPIEGRSNYKGILGATREDDFLMQIDGREYKIPLNDVLKANVEIIWPQAIKNQ